MRVDYEKNVRDPGMPVEQSSSAARKDEVSGIADELDLMPREGSAVDDPEGSRFVKISDTLLRQIAQRLRNAKR